jgi:hypothetical protein
VMHNTLLIDDRSSNLEERNRLPELQGRPQ